MNKLSELRKQLLWCLVIFLGLQLVVGSIMPLVPYILGGVVLTTLLMLVFHRATRL